MSKFVTISSSKEKMVSLETVCSDLNIGFHVEANVTHSNTLTFRLLKKDHKKLVECCKLLQ